MTTYFIGQILEVKPVDRKDKKTGQTTNHTEVTVLSDAYDTSGYRSVSTENCSIPEHWFDVLRPHIGKYVSIPYRTIHTKDGTYTFPDEALAPLVHQTNPINYDEYKPTPANPPKPTERKVS